MTAQFISEVFETLVEKAMVLSLADLEELEDDSEEWCVKETSSNEQWTFELRVGPFCLLPRFFFFFFAEVLMLLVASFSHAENVCSLPVRSSS
jgi:hypothetical protein